MTDPQGLWFKFLNSPEGWALRPLEALMNMLHLMPPLTSSDCGFRLMGEDDMIEVFSSLEDRWIRAARQFNLGFDISSFLMPATTR